MLTWKNVTIIKTNPTRRLAIRDLFINRGLNFFDLLLKPLGELTHLDLSSAFHNQGMQGFSWLLHTPRLLSLTLHNVKDVEQSLESLVQLKELRHLDISQCGEPRGFFGKPAHFLESIILALPKLSSLDISGTNLAGSSTDCSNPLCDIRGLASRVEKPLEFLGLYKTRHSASSWNNIPAHCLSGDSNEAQILEAGRRYMDRPTVLENILNDLFHVFRYETCSNLRQALDILLLAMERHNHEKHIQISGSASLYYVVKSESLKREWNVKVKRKILTTLLNGMLTHREDPTMMRNGCLTLCQFNIPQDVLFDYERLVRILLHIVSEHTSEENNFIQRAGIFLLNSLACQVDGAQKQLVGSLGAIERMLGIITEKLQAGICDDVMETAWSTMWNVTDETPVNCERFLAGGGMYLFLKCKERFPEKADLLRNMMGLLGNVAEVPELRHKLMTREFVEEFAFLLDSYSDGIEVSYNAAGVLAHMASDGPEAWTVRQPERSFVLDRMVRAINRWDISSSRNINYRSFAPIIRLVGARHTAECQLWAVWALANLTTVSPDKYCQLVEEEGGLALVEEIVNNNSGEEESEPNQDQVKSLALKVRNNVVGWKETETTGLQFDG
jgi:Zyg-11 family protein